MLHTCHSVLGSAYCIRTSVSIQLGGSVGALVGMSLVMEYAVVLLYLAAGYLTPRMEDVPEGEGIHNKRQWGQILSMRDPENGPMKTGDQF